MSKQTVTKQRAAVPKRLRAKRKRAVKQEFELGRRAIGAMEAGHREHPPGYDLAMYRAKATGGVA